jgi:DNA polymerase-3 subunit gamma/tau
MFIEELADQGQDLGRLVTDLLEHLRHLLLVQHLGEVPESLPVTQETRERLRSQANQLGEAAVIRLVDLLMVAVDDARQGGDPRLPLELALVKVTKPGSDVTRESIAYRLDQLEARGHDAAAPAPRPKPAPKPEVAAEPAAAVEEQPSSEPVPAGEPLGLDQIQQLWKQVVLPAVQERSIPLGSVLAEAKPIGLEGETLTVEFPQAASFHRTVAEKPENATLLGDILDEVTGRRLAVEYAVGEGAPDEPAEEGPTSEQEFVSLFKSTFDAREIDNEG